MGDLHPAGTLPLARRVTAGEHDVAVELCRRLDGSWSFTAMIKAFFGGELTGDLFNVLCDAWDRVAMEREADRLAGAT